MKIIYTAIILLFCSYVSAQNSNQFKNISGVFEGIALTESGKKYVKIEAYFYEHPRINHKEPMSFMKVTIFKDKKGKKPNNSFYLQLRQLNESVVKKYSLKQGEKNYELEYLNSSISTFKIEIDDKGLSISNWRNKLSGTFEKTAGHESVERLKSELEIIVLEQIVKESNKLGYYAQQASDYLFGIYNFGSYFELTSDNYLKIHAQDTLTLNFYYNQKLDENSRINLSTQQNKIMQTMKSSLKQSGILKFLPNTSVVQFNLVRKDGCRYYMDINSSSIRPSIETSELINMASNQRRLIEEQAEIDEYNSWFKRTDEFAIIREAEKFLDVDEQINFKKFGIKNYLFFENIYHGIYDQSVKYDNKELKTAYFAYFSRLGNSVHLLEKPFTLSFTVNTVKTSYLTSRITDSNDYDLILDEKYLTNVDLFKKEATTTNGFRVLAELFWQANGHTSLEEDIARIDNILPRHSKAAKRFAENFHRYVEKTLLFKNDVNLLSTRERIDLVFPLADETIKLINSSILSEGNEASDFYHIYFDASPYSTMNRSYSDFINDYKSDIIKCQYRSETYNKTYTVFFWKDNKPLIDFSKYNKSPEYKYVNESDIDMRIGNPVSSPPRNLEEALSKF